VRRIYFKLSLDGTKYEKYEKVTQIAAPTSKYENTTKNWRHQIWEIWESYSNSCSYVQIWEYHKELTAPNMRNMRKLFK